MGKWGREKLTRRQLRVLDALARESDNGLLLGTDDLPGVRPIHTLRSLERRRFARLADATTHPFLWRVTLGGLEVARRLRRRLPEVSE